MSEATPTLAKKVEALALVRDEIAVQTDLVQVLQQQLETTRVYEMLAAAKVRLDDLKAEEQAAYEDVRALAVAHPDDAHPAVTVKQYTTFTYDEAKAIAWAEKTPDAAHLVKKSLNTKGFQKVAAALKLDFVTIDKEPVATVDKDLSAYLPEDRSEIVAVSEMVAVAEDNDGYEPPIF